MSSILHRSLACFCLFSLLCSVLSDNHTTTIFSEFSLEGKTAVISGGNGGLGLEMALAYVEAGANVYAIDMPESPSEEFKIVAEHCKVMNRK